MNHGELEKKEEINGILKKKVGIIGLGYVGLPLASVCSRYFEVIGFDVDLRKIELINARECPIRDEFVVKDFENSNFKATSDFNLLNEVDIILICVPTPIDSSRKPNLAYLKSACESVSANLKEGQVVVVESTVYPATLEEVVVPILEKSGLVVGNDFGLAYCPERVDPGNQKWNVQNIPRVLASYKGKHDRVAKEFYSTFIEGGVVLMSSLKAAEAVKILENTFRDVNIAFINEMAKSFHLFGIDIHEVIRGAVTKPFGFMPFYPGPGVGGHCIPVDPYYLIDKAKKKGFKHVFLEMAREVNNSMPNYVIERLHDELNELELCFKNTKIGMLGLSYKKNIGDLRESPALEIREKLLEKKALVYSYDPHILEKSDVQSMEELMDKCDIVILVVAHHDFSELSRGIIESNKVKIVFDLINFFERSDFEGSLVKLSKL